MFDLLKEKLGQRLSDADFHKMGFAKSIGLEHLNANDDTPDSFVDKYDPDANDFVNDLLEDDEAFLHTQLFKQSDLTPRQWVKSDMRFKAVEPSILQDDDTELMWTDDTEHLLDPFGHVNETEFLAEARKCAYKVLYSLCGRLHVNVLDNSMFFELMRTFTSQLQTTSRVRIF